jgi:hypothetical protein
MRDAYTDARQVVVWIGERSKVSPLAFSLLSELYGHFDDEKHVTSLIVQETKPPQ